jgi:hypothetical protein
MSFVGRIRLAAIGLIADRPSESTTHFAFSF